MRQYQALRRARTRKIQRSSWVTNDLLHLPDGPALEERDRKVSRFPDDFGWIHEFDALQAVSQAGPRPARLSRDAGMTAPGACPTRIQEG